MESLANLFASAELARTYILAGHATITLVSKVTSKRFASLEIWHEGTCGRCGRPLTVPESIASGLGPVCAEKG